MNNPVQSSNGLKFSMSKLISRREMLKRTGQAALLSTLGFPACVSSRSKSSGHASMGAISGEEAGARVGEKVLADGGNAIDAAVAAGLTSCVATPARCGIGGYGGHMTIALAAQKKIVSIDFNSAAPASARDDMYPLDEKGEVKDRANFYGWRAVGVPGTLAGFQLALDRYGTRSFRELVQPAIEAARNGVVINPIFANTLRMTSRRMKGDPGSAKVYLKNGEPLHAGELLRNPDLAKMLSVLAERNSVETFYRGDIAHQIADACQKNGGLLTLQDLANYRAKDVEPLRLKCKDFEVFTAPLTAGGLTILQACSILKVLNWNGGARASLHAYVEALRLAWKDRLDLLGDPDQVKVPVDHLLSADYARELAAKVQAAVKEGKPISIQTQKHSDEGTNNLSSVDRHGNLVAMTITQGGSFGAQVTVDGLGLTLGHGMSRFTPLPGHPNAPGPGKRPLHNMCPTVIAHNGKPVMAVGGAGGQRIPNALYRVITKYVMEGATMEEAVAAPRLFCIGPPDVTVERRWPADQIEMLKQLGFKVRIEAGDDSHVSAALFNASTRGCRAAMR
jgi:gamma-glutamyltranspeptidase/glutathione hydrolase